MKIEKNVDFLHVSKDGKNANIFGYGDKITLRNGKEFAIVNGKIYHIVDNGVSYIEVESFTYVV